MSELSEASLTKAALAAEEAFDAAADLNQLAEAKRHHLGDDAPIPQSAPSTWVVA